MIKASALKLPFLLVLLCYISSSVASDFTLRMDFPANVVIPKPTDYTYQTNLQISFGLKNKGLLNLKVGTLKGDPTSTWYAPTVDFKLIDQAGQEVQYGYIANENLTGSSSKQVIWLASGNSLVLPYYRTVPFLISSPGTYTLLATARVQDEENTWHQSQANPVTFTVKGSE